MPLCWDVSLTRNRTPKTPKGRGQARGKVSDFSGPNPVSTTMFSQEGNILPETIMEVEQFGHWKTTVLLQVRPAQLPLFEGG